MLQAPVTVHAYCPATVIEPANEKLVTLGAEANVVVNGGPLPTADGKRKHIARAYAENPGSVEFVEEAMPHKDGKEHKCSQLLR